jgi:hypothetical protein
MNRENLVTLAVIAWLALSVYWIVTGQASKGIRFDMNGNCHGDGCAEWYAEGG